MFMGPYDVGNLTAPKPVTAGFTSVVAGAGTGAGAEAGAVKNGTGLLESAVTKDSKFLSILVDSF